MHIFMLHDPDYQWSYSRALTTTVVYLTGELFISYTISLIWMNSGVRLLFTQELRRKPHRVTPDSGWLSARLPVRKRTRSVPFSNFCSFFAPRASATLEPIVRCRFLAKPNCAISSRCPVDRRNSAANYRNNRLDNQHAVSYPSLRN